MRYGLFSLTLLLFGLLLTVSSWAGEPEAKQPPPPAPKPRSGADLLNLSLEQLMDLKITSVSKTPERAVEAPAALFVITQEDIRRSGALSIAEALRMAPGLQVARLNANEWAISSRGFNDFVANKLLVLMDGRSLYNPLFSGTLWDVQDTMLEDIERIEVIRGPGATLWGSNAVNGVINVITKSAKDTQGGLVSAGAGTEERGFGSVRYGAQPKKNVYIRGYVKYFDRDDQALPGNRDGADDWRQGRGGFRLDWDATKNDLVTFQGDAYKGKSGDAVTVPDLSVISRLATADTEVSGCNVIGRWSHKFSETSDMKLQMYYDRTDRDFVATTDEIRNTFDLDFQHQFAWGKRQTIVWGAGFRVTSDDTRRGDTAEWVPDDRTTRLSNAFVQDEITVLEKKLFITLGTKLEHNDFTGLEVQPSARLLWTPHKNHTVWASSARAVRIPNRADDDVIFNASALPAGALGPGTPPAFVQIRGDKAAKSEELLAHEIGYRVRPHPKLSLDLTGFLNMYDNLTTGEPRTPFLDADPIPHLNVPIVTDNRARGETYGGEAVATWQALKWWRLIGTYSYLNMQIHSKNSLSPAAENAEGNSPQNQAMLRSLMDLPRHVQLDFALRYVDSLPARDVHAYVTGDVRVGWRATDKLDISAVGQNLFDSQHPEWHPTGVQSRPTEVQRGFYLKATFKF
jgi:iron complex outermembrane receptor protein